MTRYYAGVGSRKTPSDVLRSMREIATDLEERSFVLRSGHAPGADRAFEAGVRDDAHKNIYLPWARFEGSGSPLFYVGEEAWDSVDRYHPAPGRLSLAARRLIARDWYQIVGRPGEPPSLFVVCWTPDGKIAGGTGQALRIAIDQKITIYNLATPGARDDLTKAIADYEKEEI